MKKQELKNQLQNIKKSKTARDIDRMDQENKKIEIIEMNQKEFRKLRK